jgi:RHS repeat-associated protein
MGETATRAGEAEHARVTARAVMHNARGNPTTNLHDVSHQDFEPFGANPGNALTRAGFTGHANDTDLGLIDMGGRIYDPLAGRFMTEDPVMQAPHWSQGLNPYSYVFNDPINHTDPSGFSADVDVGGAIVGGIVGAGHLAAPALFAAGFGGNFGAAAVTGGLGGAINLGISSLLATPGAGSGPKTITTPGGTHAPGSVGGSGSSAAAQHGEIPQGQESGPSQYKGDWRTQPAPKNAQVWEEVMAGAALCGEIPGCPQAAAAAGAAITVMAVQTAQAIAKAAPKAWDWIVRAVKDIDASKPPFRGEPGSTWRGRTQSRRYGPDGYPEVDRDWPHPDEAGIGSGDHVHDWGRPPDGAPPTNADRGVSRLPAPEDPPPPRGPAN